MSTSPQYKSVANVTAPGSRWLDRSNACDDVLLDSLYFAGRLFLRKAPAAMPMPVMLKIAKDAGSGTTEF